MRAPQKPRCTQPHRLAWVACFFIAACQAPVTAPAPTPVKTPAATAPAGDPYVALARALLASPCTVPTPTPPIPRGVLGEASGAPRTDVVFYTAHPDDEAMYGGGTMHKLVRAGRRVALAVMSHGEGGRLLVPTPSGARIERRDLPREQVVIIRDQEIARASGAVPVELAHVYPAAANVDYGFTTSCEEALRHWDANLPAGISGMLRRVVADLRMRRPRVVVTLDPRDDPEASHHGHHRAVGTVVEAAARAAADPRFGGGRAHAVEEVVTYAPQGGAHDVALSVGSAGRLAMLRAYRSQFAPEHLESAVARREVEHFVVRWRVGAPAGLRRSLLEELAVTRGGSH